ncbi:10107_t:CDS:2 [Rhizophagus irregularis]|nr:10107_t:CDS:2 [Rhizophagus irregularis]
MDFMNYKRSLDWRNFLEFGFGREVTVQGRLSFQGDSDLEGFFLSKFIEGTEELGKRKKG